MYGCYSCVFIHIIIVDGPIAREAAMLPGALHNNNEPIFLLLDGRH